MKLKLLYKMVMSIIVSIFITLFLIFFVFDGILNSAIAETTYSMSHKLYYSLIAKKDIMVVILFYLVGIITIYFTIARSVKKFVALLDAIHKAYEKNEQLEELPEEFSDVAAELNEIRYRALKNEKAAQEAEVRKNDLIVYMAHDLKTPLTSIIGYLSLVKEEKNLPKDLQEKYVNISLEKAERLEDLINEFFEITRYNVQNMTVEKSKIDFSMLLNQVVDEFYPLLLPKGLNFQIAIEEKIIINGDAKKLARVFDNLIRNAINYSNKETTIEVEAKQEANSVIIKVKDKGEKIPEYKLNQIFEKFYRLDAARTTEKGGAGLGLAIAKEIVDLHGGTIQVTSNNEITEFCVRLPIQ